MSFGRILALVLIGGLVLAAFFAWQPISAAPPRQPDSPDQEIRLVRDGWTQAQLATLRSLSLDALALPPAESNRVANEPEAAKLGHRLFFDRALSSNGRVACADCHRPELAFTDGKRVSTGIETGTRNSPSLIGLAASPWMFWDGRRDSLWSQALAVLETRGEMGDSRIDVVRSALGSAENQRLYRALFGEPPDIQDPVRFPVGAGPFAGRSRQDAWLRMKAGDRKEATTAFVNLGKAIAAYERKLLPSASRFDQYVRSLGAGPPSENAALLDERERAGLALLIDPARSRCLQCHNGPLLSNFSFHAVGTGLNASGQPDFGRFLGLQSVLVDPFNCLGPHSDASAEGCAELRFVNKSAIDQTMGQFRTPTLRNIDTTGPYMHDGRFDTLEAVIGHYRASTEGGSASELIPMEISDAEADQLVAFLKTLTSPASVEARWLAAPSGSAP